MSDTYILYFTAAQHFVYRRAGGAVSLEAKFSADDLGVSAFREYLATRKGVLFSVVADLAGEDFHEDQIPALRGQERRAVIERRLAQRYRDTRLAAALSLGIVTGERRNERLLLASFTNTQQFAPWMDAISESGVRLAGVFSAPMLAPGLAERLGVRGGRCLVVTANRSGLRQSYVDNGRLRFSRLEQTVEMTPEALAMFIRSETFRLVQYLSTLRAIPRDGPPVRVVVVAPRGQQAVFERTLGSDTRLTFVTVDAAEAHRRVGMRKAPEDGLSELLYVMLAARQPPAEQFASADDRRGYVVWQLQRAIAAAGLAGFVLCALFAGSRWLDLRAMREVIELQRGEARLAGERYSRITQGFPVTQTTTENLRATVNEFTRIANGTAAPEPMLRHLSSVLEHFPEVELDRLEWSSGGAAPAVKPRPAAPAPRPAPGAREPAGPMVTLEVSGRVGTTAGSDYRAITEKVEEFADRLRVPPFEILRTQLPFDVSSEGTLSGDVTSASSTGEAPRFTIVLARPLS